QGVASRPDFFEEIETVVLARDLLRDGAARVEELEADVRRFAPAAGTAEEDGAVDLAGGHDGKVGGPGGSRARHEADSLPHGDPARVGQRRLRERQAGVAVGREPEPGGSVLAGGDGERPAVELETDAGEGRVARAEAAVAVLIEKHPGGNGALGRSGFPLHAEPPGARLTPEAAGDRCAGLEAAVAGQPGGEPEAELLPPPGEPSGDPDRLCAQLLGRIELESEILPQVDLPRHRESGEGGSGSELIAEVAAQSQPADPGVQRQIAAAGEGALGVRQVP